MMTAASLIRPVEILLVEDSPSDANLAIAALKEGGIRNHVHHVEDGAEAMAFLRQEAAYSDAPRPDLILLDLNLPKMDGYQVLAEIQKEPRFRDIPAIVLTASADPHDIEVSYSLGASYYITKPADLHEFITTMDSVKHAAAALQQLGVDIDRFLSNRVGNLDLTASQVADESLEHLRGLTQLMRLWLADTHTTDAGLHALQEMNQLEWLDLSRTQITDAGLLLLRRMTNLRRLWLTGTPVTDAGLEHLRLLASLEFVDLAETQVTPAAAEQLRQALPGVTVQR